MFKAGDKIRRVKEDYMSVKIGDVVTFKKYSIDGLSLHVEEYSYAMYSNKFELVEDKAKRISYGTTAFEDVKIGDEVYSINFGWGKIDYISKCSVGGHYIKVKFDICNSSIQYNNNGHRYSFDIDTYEPNQSLFWDEVIIEAPIKKREKTYKNEFIAAMRTLIKEYNEGTHILSYSHCSLCKVVSSIVGTKGNSARPKDCSICPWMVITGKNCSIYKDGNRRIKELVDWIEIYERMDEYK